MTESGPVQPGQRVGAGRFVLNKPLGRGGMGEVWLAQDERLNEPVALKFLPPEVRADPAAIDDLRRETARSHRLAHPNIVRIYDLHEQEGEPAFISMEYVDGPTLSALRLQQPNRVYTWEFLQPLVQQLCDALDYAHGEKVIHRDLKPGNILLARPTTVGAPLKVKLADFGIAAVVSDSVSRVSAQRTSGTLAYMSPQQMDGEKPQVTDDIYALGATLYELLTSKPPFYTGDIPHQVRTLAPQPLGERLADLGLANDIPPDVAALVMACLAKDPAQRPHSARAVAEWIGRELETEPQSESLAASVMPAPAVEIAEPVGAEREPMQAWPAPRRRQWWALAGTAVALLLFGLTAWKLRGHFGGAKKSPRFDLVFRLGGSGVDSGEGIAVDKKGNIFVTGMFNGTTDFGGTRVTSTVPDEIYVAKFGSAGRLEWFHPVGATRHVRTEDMAKNALAVDAEGNVFLAATFKGSARFGPSQLASQGEWDLFTAKFDTTGSPLWARRAGGSKTVWARNLVVDRLGNCSVSGGFAGRAMFEAVPLETATWDGFIASYDAAGQLRWAKQSQGPGWKLFHGLACDEAGNSYVTGFYGEGFTLDTVPLPSQPGFNTFLCKYDQTGTVAWAKRHVSAGECSGKAAAADAAGNSYVLAGSRFETVKAPIGVTAHKIEIARYDPAGQVRWTRELLGSFYILDSHMAVDSEGSCYVVGGFEGTAQVGNITLKSAGDLDVFVAKLSTAGEFLWAKSAGGLGFDRAYAIAVRQPDECYVTGIFGGSAAFDGIHLTSAGEADIFLARLAPTQKNER